MKNLEQIRARNALKCATESGHEISGSDGGEVIKKIPPHIMNFGLLATGAYAFSENSRGWAIVFDCIAKHLADPDIRIVPSQIKNHTDLMSFLTSDKVSCDTLNRATSESLAWLSYARRFVKKPTNKKDD